MDEIEREYSELLRAARALIGWEREIAELGFPEAELPPPITAPAPLSIAEPSAAPAQSQQAEEPHQEIQTVQRVQEPAAQAAPAAPIADERSRAPLSVLGEQRARVESCAACALSERRTKTVFSRGREDARIMMIGEGPGEKEDLSGLPFVGPAGQLLDRMIQAMGFARDDVYICNIVKCRPPGNRAPRPDEIEACRHFLDAQIDAIAPELIIALGRSAAEALHLVDEGGRWRGRFASYRGRTTLATFHPSFLLRSPEQKRVAWADLKEALAFLGRPVPR